MTSKLALYNDANLILGERKLSSLSESRPSRRRLDTVWDGGAVKFCLEQAPWNFAMHSVEITHSPSVDPGDFANYAFDKPTDWCRTFMVSADATFTCPLLDFEDQGAYWYANVDPLFVRYVSDDAEFGGDLSLWPENFTQYAAHYFAWKACKATNGSSSDKQEIERAMIRALSKAKATDAVNEPTRFPAQGSWASARRGFGRGRREGGSSGNLIG